MTVVLKIDNIYWRTCSPVKICPPVSLNIYWWTDFTGGQVYWQTDLLEDMTVVLKIDHIYWRTCPPVKICPPVSLNIYWWTDLQEDKFTGGQIYWRTGLLF